MAVKVLLQEVRKAKGLSQNELARLIEMSPQNIQKIEQGDAKSLTFATLGRLCKALSCQPGDLLIYVDDPETDESEVTPGQQEKPRRDRSASSGKHSKRRYPRSALDFFSNFPDSA